MPTNDPYRSIAPLYDLVTASFLEEPRRRAVALCRRLGLARVLDLGCGTGILVRMLARAGVFAVGVDVSAAMLFQGGRQRPGASGAKGVSLPGGVPAFHEPSADLEYALVRGNGAALPFFSGSFDAAVCSLVLHESEVAPDVLLAEALRVAPRVIALEWRMPERNLDYLNAFWVHGIEWLAGRAHYAHFRAFMRSGGVRGLARRAGCVVSHEETLKAGALTLVVLERPSMDSPAGEPFRDESLDRAGVQTVCSPTVSS